MNIPELKILETIILLVLSIIIKFVANKSVNRFLSKFDFDIKRKRITIRIINLFLWIFVGIVLAGIWNIDERGFVVFITSIITVMGVAFFAQWSILSNITSSLILFFNHPLKIGDKVRVLDKDCPFEGEISDLTYFFVHLTTDEGEVITVPNSLFLEKSITIIATTEKK